MLEQDDILKKPMTTRSSFPSSPHLGFHVVAGEILALTFAWQTLQWGQFPSPVLCTLNGLYIPEA